MDLELRAPLYTHFTEALTGLSTIRAFGWSDAFLEENTRRLGMSQKPFYLMFCIQRWLQVVLDLFVAGMALVLVSMALKMSRSTSEGKIALAMVNLLGFNYTLTLFIDQWTQVETSLGAIARLKIFMRDTPNEDEEPEKTLPLSDWPAQGAIEFEDISACYSDVGDVVLRNISLSISPGQKVCICGRSGRLVDTKASSPSRNLREPRLTPVSYTAANHHSFSPCFALLNFAPASCRLTVSTSPACLANTSVHVSTRSRKIPYALEVTFG